MSKQLIYTVTAYRHGNHNDHSYIVGAFTEINNAMAFADTETSDRGGKYACEVEEIELDKNYGTLDVEPKVIYKTKSRFQS